MEISKELLERYHTGSCSDEERACVEAWLQEDGFGDVSLPETTPAEADRDMWKDISSYVDNAVKTHPLRIWKKIAVAASLLLLVGAVYYSLPKVKDQQTVSFSNSSDTEVKNIDYSKYSIAMAPNSNGKIDAKTGVFHFCGSLLVSPKSDMELSFVGLKQKVKLKTGQTYIVLSTNCPSDQPIIINEKDVYNLPPVIQRQLSTQFSI